MNIVDFAEQILAMDRKLADLESENAELRVYRDKYIDLLNEGNAHGERLMAGLLEIALTPGVPEALEAARAK